MTARHETIVVRACQPSQQMIATGHELPSANLWPSRTRSACIEPYHESNKCTKARADRIALACRTIQELLSLRPSCSSSSTIRLKIGFVSILNFSPQNEHSTTGVNLSSWASIELNVLQSIHVQEAS